MVCKKLHETFIENKLLPPAAARHKAYPHHDPGEALCIGVVIGTLITVIKYFTEGCPGPKAPGHAVRSVCHDDTRHPGGGAADDFLLCHHVPPPGVSPSASSPSASTPARPWRSSSAAASAPSTRARWRPSAAFGMSKVQAMRKIVFPQAVLPILPAIGNKMIRPFGEETSVAGLCGGGRSHPRLKPRAQQHL